MAAATTNSFFQNFVLKNGDQPEYLHPYLVKSSSSSLSLCYPSRFSNSAFLCQIFNAAVSDLLCLRQCRGFDLNPTVLPRPPLTFYLRRLLLLATLSQAAFSLLPTPPETTPKATPSDLLSLLGPNRHSSAINPLVARELQSCFKFLVSFAPNRSRTVRESRISRRSSAITDTKKNPFSIKVGMAQMLRGGAILEVIVVDQAKLAEDAGACAISELRSSAGVAISAR